MASWLESVRNPGAEHRSIPLWVWNNAMTRERITGMLEDFAAAGMGGVFVHPRPGLVTPYLGEEWFDLWGFALAECRRLGLQCNVYDENSYPSGFAGGQVMRRIPWAAAMLLVPMMHWGADDKRAAEGGSGLKELIAPTPNQQGRWRPDGELVGAWRMDGDAPSAVEAGEVNTLLSRGVDVMTAELRRDAASPWTAWYPYTDLTRREVAEAFLATTHEQYKTRFGDAFGREIRSFFTDEPHLASAGAGAMYGGFPFSRHIAREFRREHGYDLLPRVADLLFDSPTSAATRFDYYDTLSRLFRDNYVKVLFDWAEASGVETTGHFMEHEWPYPFINPNTMDCYRFQHIPGIDLLRPQYDYDDPRQSAIFLLTVRELNSAANQCGKARRFCELHGVGGFDATFENFKRLIDWLVVHGVNYLDEHLAFATLAGVRKYDHPQTFTDHSSWFPGPYRSIGDYQARLVAALVPGRQDNRVLVLHPTCTGWVLATPAEPKNPPVGGPALYDTPSTRLRDAQMGLVQFLCDNQVDFDLGDETVLREIGSADGARLRCGEGAYDVLVVPRGVRALRESTLGLLDAFQAAGGVVLALDDAAPDLVDGRPDARPAELAKAWHRCADDDALLAEIRRVAPPRIAAAGGGALPGLLHHLSKVHDDGSRVHFLANTDPGAVAAPLRIAGAGPVASIDADSGELLSVPFRPDGDGVVVDLELPRGGSMLLVQGPAAEGAQPPVERHPGGEITLGPWTIERAAPNVLALDYCDLVCFDEVHEALFVTHANKLAWQLHGHDRDLWDRGVQVGQMYLDMEFDADSGFETVWRFEVDGSALAALRRPGSVRVAIENPQLYEVRVNGHAVDVAAGERWLDEVIKAADCSAALVAGSNEIRVRAPRFHPLCEIDRIYLVGDFATEPAKPGWRLSAPKPLAFGDWVAQGLTMYDQAVSYRASLMVPEAGCVRLDFGGWEGACLRVRLAGRERIAYLRGVPAVFDAVAAGAHEVEVEVFGTPRNMMGPHFDPNLKYCAGPPHWDAAPRGPVDGQAYCFMPYGLLEPPTARSC